MGLAYAVEILPPNIGKGNRVSFGLTLNFWDDGLLGLLDNTWEKNQRLRGQTTIRPPRPGFSETVMSFDYNTNEKYSLDGFNANLGLLWEYDDPKKDRKFNVGVVFKSPFTADLTREYVESHIDKDAKGNVITPQDEQEQRGSHPEELDMPMSYGIGISYESDRFSIGGDIYRTEWGDYVRTDETGKEFSPITGLPPDESDVDATCQIRIGGEYRLSPAEIKMEDVPSIYLMRGGVFYDPAPAKGSPDEYYGVSLGLGYTKFFKHDRGFSFDIAWQCRFGNDVGASIVGDRAYYDPEYDEPQTGSYGFSQDVREHTVYSSLTIYF